MPFGGCRDISERAQNLDSKSLDLNLVLLPTRYVKKADPFFSESQILHLDHEDQGQASHRAVVRVK